MKLPEEDISLHKIRAFLKTFNWFYPTNLIEEKEKFFQENLYNPQLTYPSLPIDKLRIFEEILEQVTIPDAFDASGFIRRKKLEETKLKLKLILARALDVDIAAVHGTCSKEYQEMAAKITVSIKDAQRLGLKDNSPVQISSKTSQVVVRAKLDDKTPEGLAVMQPSPWANALLPPTPPHQGTPIILKLTKAAITSIDKFP